MNFKNELSEELEFLLFYTSRRAGSIVRLMIVNSIFLLAMLGVYFYSRDAGYLLGNILSWFLPSLLCLALVVLFECYPQLLDKYGLRSPYAWKQVGYFLLSLRAYNLLRIVMEFLQIDFANGTVCTDFEGHMHGNVLSSVHIMVDYMEAYVWTGILFQAPWGVLFCTVEMCTTCLRLWSCLPILKPYISSVFNPHWFVVPYYVLLAVVHSFLIESYRRNMRDIDTVKSTIVNLKQEQEQAHRHVKISLQYIWGSLSKFKKLYVNPSDVRDNIKHAVSRNIKAATLIMDNLTVLHALENNTLTSGKTAVTDLLVVVRDLIMELEDFSVQHINIRKSLADDRARRSTLLCSEAIMQSVFGNVAYFIMSMIRRRSLRQRVGYNPYLNVCGYFYELLHKNGARQLMVRLVFDHNGDMMGDGAPDSSEVFDGTEIFEIPGSMGTKADHFINNATCVLSLRTYRVQTCRDVYSSTDRLASSGSLSPLCLSLLHDVLVQCGGSFLVQDYFIADDDVRSRTVQFGRIVVDLPCMDNSLKIIPRLGHKIFKSGSNIAISTDKKEEESIKYAVLLADKSLQATVLAGLRNFGVKTSVFAHKRILTGALDFDVDKILLERYTHVLFDVESVGLALRQGGFSGERVFFAANSIMLQSSQGVNASYDSVLPVPCRNNVLKRFVFSNANSMPAVVSKEYSSTEQLKNDVLSQYAQVEQIFMHIDRYARVGIFTELAKAKAPLLVLKFLQRFMIGLFSVFYFIFFDRIDTPINTTSHNPESLTSVKFGSQFSFSGVFLGMPLFARELERKASGEILFIIAIS